MSKEERMKEVELRKEAKKKSDENFLFLVRVQRGTGKYMQERQPATGWSRKSKTASARRRD
ncbi:hypothetical protein DPMN_008372 [Dreissena polymorpha]|uniref:Uncharacterized protein n=1 Tax=Dreissena polymorpha TaxID=45954 RepID=A0A9D4MZ59_DREPO|nr:hypothetical protein DPMN_008372 [Dreissena polymorpha]